MKRGFGGVDEIKPIHLARMLTGTRPMFLSKSFRSCVGKEPVRQEAESRGE